MRALLIVTLGTTFMVAGCTCVAGTSDGGLPDVHQCRRADVETSTPIETAAPLPARHLLTVFGSTSNSINRDVDAVRLADGSLVLVTDLPTWDSEEGESVLVRAYIDGAFTPLGISRPAGPEIGAELPGLLLRAADDRGGSAPRERHFRLEVSSLDGAGVIALSEPLLFENQLCNGSRRYTPNVSAGRLLVLRPNCARDYAVVAERWEQRDASVVRVTGPFRIPEPTDDLLSGARSTYADGRGGVYWVGRPRSVLPDRADRQIAVGHWDGDAEPVISETLGPVGTTTDFALGLPHPSGDFIALANHVLEGFTRTIVARVRPDTTFAWQWTSPPGYLSGPAYPAATIVGDEDILVVLMQPAARDHLFAMRLGPDGTQRWAEPRAIQEVEGLLTNAEGGAAVAGHADGSFHVLWANDIGMTSVRAFDPEGEPLWPSREGITVSSGLQGQILADGAGGVWVAVNATPGGGFVQHFDREGWPLYRYWVYPPCGRVSGFVARASAASEPITYFSPEWF